MTLSTKGIGKGIGVVVALTAICACSATPNKSTEESVQAELAQAAAEPEKTCRFIQVTGSHRYKKVCMTTAAKEEVRKNSEAWMRARQRQGGVNPVSTQ